MHVVPFILGVHALVYSPNTQNHDSVFSHHQQFSTRKLIKKILLIKKNQLSSIILYCTIKLNNIVDKHLLFPTDISKILVHH